MLVTSMHFLPKANSMFCTSSANALDLCTSKFYCGHYPKFNSLPNDKILDRSRLEAYADSKMILTEKLKFVLGRLENIVGKGGNAGYQHFLLFPQFFQKASCTGSFKIGIV